MMGFDMGGPVNKVAYAFGLAGLASGNLQVMAAVMAAGMVPPLGMALATVLRKHLFSDGRARGGRGRLAAGGVVHHRRGASPSPPRTRCG